MKPTIRDMHSSLMDGGGGGDEGGGGARDVFVDLGVLIVEGRVPGAALAAGRGYGEGPHCVRTAPPLAMRGHACDRSLACVRAANLRKHTQLLCENRVPMCVEVLLCADCPCGVQRAQSPEVANVPSATDLLLEQWTISVVTNKNGEPAPMTTRGLLQAVRSQLHFSQLSAWWSSSHGTEPAHVNYRVTVPGEAFASHFRSTPVTHVFPTAALTRTSAIKVAVRTAPRMETVPRVLCSVHHDAETRTQVEEPGDNRADKMLGECLLDQGRSRRYQSPQRTCSPSLDAPERLKLGRREASPPSPPASLQHGRQGREGLTRRRDAEWRPTSLVDDRMQHPCNRSGKHHCRCDEEPELEPQPAWRNHPAKVEPARRESVTKEPGWLQGVTKVEPARKEGMSKELSWNESGSKEEAAVSKERREGKHCKRVKKEGECGKSRLNLELSPREFEEVLSVLRERNPSVLHHGTKSVSRSPDSFKSEPPQALAGKSDLFMEAILRTQDLSTTTTDDLASALSNKIAKISLDSLTTNKPSSYSASGTKRKRLETKASTCDPDTGSNLSASIDERTLSCVPRKINKPRCKVPNSESVIEESGGRESPESQDRPVPTALDKEKFRRSLDFAASMVFHSRTGLPLTSSPAPVRRNATCFAYDSTITSVSAIRSALFDSEVATGGDDVTSSDDAESEGRSPCSPRTPFPPVAAMWSRYTHLASSLLGTFEESALNGRLEPVSTVQGFTANLGASGSFCPRHVVLPVTVFFYTLGDNDKVSTPYLAHINLGKKGYNVPRCGTIQVTLFNPLGTVVKMFVVMYDLTDMPANSQTFLRQRTLYMPANTGSTRQPDNFQKWLRYLVHLRFSSSKSGRVYLHSDIRMIIFRKSDLDTATAHGVDMSYELRSFTQGPTNPKFSSRK